MDWDIITLFPDSLKCDLYLSGPIHINGHQLVNLPALSPLRYTMARSKSEVTEPYTFESESNSHGELAATGCHRS